MPTKAKPKPRQAGGNLAALEIAFEEFLEEGYAYQVNKQDIEEMPAERRSEALRGHLPERTQADGYFTWLRYIVWLDGVREFDPFLRLTANEAQGIALYQRIRNRFNRSHPPCMHCGMPNADFEFQCHHCYKELKR